ncbi:hypothetical protein LTR70_007901 [Exophiala xenobiotica]|uniref:RRM domain-containing protein n=1 Tax=Lithohypha guttulata TaxID=1690604 RepID=A0ABR0K8U2_9EURO|nr:hypothetical protein LTR24_005577 [Lithohypha guttulata]KAK5312906.1 hypothetical protein LTR70_007901 [Exophiala xenobiotica]
MPVATSRKGVGVYYVVVDGVPQHCQWQELKDYLRDGAKVNPGYANVLKVNEDGTRVGFCPLRSKADANHAFDYLVAEGWNGFDIRVSLIWKSDLQSEEIHRRRGPEQSRRRRVTNATPALPSFSSQGANSTRSAPATSTPYSMSGMSQALPQVSYPNAAPNSRLSPGQYSQLASHPPRYPYDQSITSTVLTPSTRSTVYATHRQHASTDLDDLIYTDQQSIHISRLPHDTSAQDLQKLLSRSGTVSNLSIKRGKEKRCSATARYKTPAEAAHAIRDLNGRKVGKMTLVVRYDRNEAGSTSSAPSTTSKGSDSDSSTAKQMLVRTGPLVVDGAKGPGYHKRREDDDDSESTGDSSGDEGQTTVKWPQGLLRQPTAKDGRR